MGWKIRKRMHATGIYDQGATRAVRDYSNSIHDWFVNTSIGRRLQTAMQAAGTVEQIDSAAAPQAVTEASASAPLGTQRHAAQQVVNSSQAAGKGVPDSNDNISDDEVEKWTKDLDDWMTESIAALPIVGSGGSGKASDAEPAVAAAPSAPAAIALQPAKSANSNDAASSGQPPLEPSSVRNHAISVFRAFCFLCAFGARLQALIGLFSSLERHHHSLPEPRWHAAQFRSLV